MDGKVNSLLIPSDGSDLQFFAGNDVSSRPPNHAGLEMMKGIFGIFSDEAIL